MMRNTTMGIPMDYTKLIDELIRVEVIDGENDINLVKNVIRNEVEKRRSSLQVTDGALEKHHAKLSLSTTDNAYIQKKYIEYCLELWVQEVESFLKDNHIKLSSGNLSYDIFQDLINSLNTIHNLRQIPKPLNELRYYKQLMKNHGLINLKTEKTFLRKIKSICYLQIIPYIEFVQTELDFLNAFVDFLLVSKSIQEIIDKLQLRSFCCGDLPFDKLLDGIGNLEVDAYEREVIVLKETADCLKAGQEPFLTKTFKEVINAYIQPVEIQKKTLDGRLVVEVRGKCIVMSEILPELETRISNNFDIEEIRIVGADILHADVNLGNEIWHGKNVIILAKIMKIYNRITWNVSGKDNHHIYHHNAGTGDDGHGKRGEDGLAGESGGNILINVDEIKNPENFTIISHGGRGGKGQDGGDGRDGDNGIGITEKEFKEKFPSVVLFLNNRLKRCRLFDKTVENIEESSTLIEPAWKNNRDVFIRAMTSEGNEITFSYCSSKLDTCLQSFLLYKGSFGKPGKRGGESGCGGKGGYNGNITLNNRNINVHADRGEMGQYGKGGLYGYHGKNSWDMGYADWQLWPEAKFYGTDLCSKLQLTYLDTRTTWGSAPTDSVWCPYRQKYVQITYAGKLEQTKEIIYTERMNTRQNNAPQHQAMATRKKTILQEKIVADYTDCYSSQDRSGFQSLQAGLDNSMQRILQEMVENAEQQDKVTTEMKVRHVKSARRDRDIRRKGITAATSNLTFRDTTKVDIRSLINTLTSDGGLHGQQKKLNMNEIDRSDLERLFLEVEKKMNSSSENSKKRDLEQILNEKYRFAVLREIAIQLPGDHNATNPMVIPECVSRYLIVDEEKKNIISHPNLGTLNQYLYANLKMHREQVCTFFDEKLRNSADHEFLKSSVGIFVLKVGKSEQAHLDVRKYYLEYEEFSKKKDQSLKVYLEALYTELKRYKNIFVLWIERNNNRSAKIALGEEIRKNPLLNALYNRYNQQLEREYDWTKCCVDKNFLEEYHCHLCENGPFSECYRELLAHVFDVNIKLYFKDRDNQFCMQDNYNPSSRRAIHVLKQGNEFKQLNIDEDYLGLEEERTEAGRIYAKILAETENITKKHELDDYLEEEIFLTDDVSENDSQWSYGNNSEEGEDVSDYGTEELEDTGDKMRERCIRAYILKVGESETAHPEVQKYCNEFKELSKTREKSWNIYFEPFHSELRRYKHVFALWIASNNHESAKSDLKEEMKKYNFLNALHNRFDNELKKFDFDWNECYENKAVGKAFEKYVRENGPPSECYRELRHHTDQDNKLENSCTDIFAENELTLQEESDYALKTQSTCYSDSEVSDNQYLIREQQDIDGIIKYFGSPAERLQIKERLEKITFQYTGQRGILHYLLSRFSRDGRHVSFQELCYLVNSILISVVQDRKELSIFCWIVAAYSQKNWLDELVILQLENHLKKSLLNKSKWRQYLSKVTNKDILLSLTLKLNKPESNSRVSAQCIEDALYLLSEIPNEAVNLETLDLREWPDALKEKYWTHKVTKLTNWEKNEDLSAASYYLLAMENTSGHDLIKEFLKILESKNVSPGNVVKILFNFHTERWNLSGEVLKSLSTSRIDIWITKMEKIYIADQKARDVTRLVELIKGNASDGISKKLPAIENSLRTIRKEKPAIDEQPRGRIKRIFNWLSGTSNATEGASNKLSATKIPSNAVNKLKQFTLWIKNGEDNSEETSNTSPTFVDSRESNRKVICGITEESAGNMTTDDLKMHFRMFREHLDSSPISKKKQFIEEARIGMLAVVDRAIEIKRGFKLRDTQMLAILALLTNERKTLAQVATGEGKSLIVVAAAIMKVSCREKVDIITSSSVLAKRDAEGNEDIYSVFDINVSHNCSDDIERRRKAYSSGQVVYGDLSNFQRDFLLDRFYDKNILGDRTFENVFVDEVDSMLLDKGNNMLYLSHDIPGFDKLESLYVYIWNRVNRPAGSCEDFSSIFDPVAIKESVLNDLYGLVTREDIKILDSELDDQQATIIWERLIDAEMLDEQGKMLIGNIDANQLETVLPSKFIAYANRLCYLLKESIRRNKMIHVPNYLKPFIEQHLDSWIKSAITAATMQEGHDYVMEPDKTGTTQDLNPHVTIVDRDTGTYQANSQWDEALHQYLQLKHGCKISLQSLKAVFISNVSYLKLYTNLYGVTGTLGSRRERDLLLEIHDVDFVTIPTAMPKQFYEEVPVLCTEKKEWLDRIFSEAMECTDERKRSILIICETIDDAEALERDFDVRGAKNIHTYTRDYDKLDIAQGTRELEPGHIIIATNLCGRGTDIKITEELRNAGGLHVCLTYLPNNNRIEQQAFGRGARSGDRGSGRLIVMDAKGKEYSNLKILDLKQQRDAEELLRIPSIKAYYQTQIITEERYFGEFKQQYQELEKNLTEKNVPAKARKILMESCLNKWAFWLDKNSKCMENLADEDDRNSLENLLEEFILQLNNLRDKDNESWVEGQPMQMIKLGKYFCQVKKYDDAIELFDKVIELEPCFSEAAHYYKAFALMKKIDWSNKALYKQSLKEFEIELREAGRLFKKHSEFSICAAGIIDSIKEHNQRSIIQTDTYQTQQKSFSNLYDTFSQSIDDVFDQPVTPQSFRKNDIDAELSEIIYEDLLSNGILKKFHLENNISEETCNKISFQYGIASGKLKSCLSAFEGKEIDEKEFNKTLKMSVQLPSREDFWKLLLQENILSQEVKCIIIDVERLDKVDPLLSRSLHNKINNEELDQQTLEYNDPNEIVLNTEQTNPQKECIILEKSAFQNVLANDDQKYKFLKKKGVFTSNKKARIDFSKILSSLPRYDSITLQDFSEGNIARNDAEKILARLVEEKVLKKVNSENDTYRLGIPWNQMELIQFPAYPVYRNAVIGLLSLCFTYRIALERIEEQLQENKNNPIDRRLLSKPHHDLICELIDQNIISPAKYSTEIKDLRKRLNDIYSRTLTKDNLESMLSESRLIPEELITDDVCNYLVAQEWLRVDDGESDVPETDSIHAYLVEMNFSFDSEYYINDSITRQELLAYEDIEETFKKIFDTRIKLAGEATIQHIIRILERSRSPLNTLKNCDSNLKSLTEYNSGMDGSRHMEEVNILTLNGLDQVLQIKENKWSAKMLFNSAIVMLLGVCQIVAGIAIDILAFTIAATFISEGISDISFGFRILCSGHFSWTDYMRHKIRNVMLTVANVSVGALLSRCANVLRFGFKVAPSALDIGQNVAETTSSQIFQTAAARGIVMAAENHLTLKTFSASAVDSAYGGVDVIVENYLRTLCDGIRSAFLSCIRNVLEGCNIPVSLEKIYQILGEDTAAKFVIDLSDKFLNKQGLTKKYLPIASKTAHLATEEIKNAVETISQSRNTRYTSLDEIMNAVLALLPTAEDLVDVVNLRNTTSSFLNNVEKKLTITELDDELENNPGQNALVRDEEKLQACESFKKKSMEQWHLLLDEKVEQIMKEHVVRPILDEGANCLMGYCEKLIKTGFQSRIVGRNNERSKELGRQYQESQRSNYTPMPDHATEIETYALNEYHKNLNMLTTKLSEPKLLAALVRENVPMDVTCLNVFTKIISKVSGNEGLTIVAKGSDGTEQRFSFLVDGAAEVHIIRLELINNRFVLHGSSALESNGYGKRKNNFLYEAISGHINLNMTREDFRAEIANCIEHDPDIQCHIKQGLNSYSTSFVSSGKRESIESVDKLCKNPIDKERQPVKRRSRSVERPSSTAKQPVRKLSTCN